VTGQSWPTGADYTIVLPLADGTDPRPVLCDATLRHAHGVTRCTLPAGHRDPLKHRGHCYREECWDVVLEWTQQHESWPIA
jgi:hypothetical protein